MKLNEQNKHVYCPAPFHEQMVDSDGTIKICCSARHTIRNDDGTQANITNTTLDKVWNNKHMQEIRQNMIDGIKPADNMCENCYSQEKYSNNSSRIHELEQYTDYIDTPIVEELPDYYDLRFGNLCNLQCIMCDPHYSSRLMTEQEKVLELLKLNEYANSDLLSWYTNSNTLWNRSESEKYSWPANELIFNGIVDRMSESKCRKVYVNGGEPTLHNKSLVKMLKTLVDSGQSANIELWINTNATLADLQFYSLLNNFKKIRLMLSIDGIEESFEYIRYPAKWNVVDSNIRKITKFISTLDSGTDWDIEFQPTFQLLNLLDLERMIEYWLDIRQITNCRFNLSKLNNPRWYDAILANSEIKESINAKIQEKFKSDEKHIKQVTSYLNDVLLYKDDIDEHNRQHFIDLAVNMHKIFKNIRNIDYLDEWFYKTIKLLR